MKNIAGLKKKNRLLQQSPSFDAQFKFNKILLSKYCGAALVGE